MQNNPFKKIAAPAIVGLSIIFLQGCGEKLDTWETKNIGGLIYNLKTNQPFTGTVTNYPLSGGEQFAFATCEMQVKQGVQSGKTICKAQSGTKISETEYENGKKHGLEEKFSDENKTISKINWKEGKKYGTEESFHKINGKLISQINWLNDAKEGKEKQWSANDDKVIIDFDWKNGKQTGTINTDSEKSKLKDGEYDGTVQKYRFYQTANDSIEFRQVLETNYVKGKRDGLHKEWDMNANLVFQATYKNNIIQSKLEQWWDKGKIITAESGINISPEGRSDEERFFVKDGKELSKREIAPGIVGVLEIEWDKGNFVKGAYRELRAGKPFATYNGVLNKSKDAAANGPALPVKDGVENVFNKNGEHKFEIMWSKGVAVKINDVAPNVAWNTPNTPTLDKPPSGNYFPVNHLSKTVSSGH